MTTTRPGSPSRSLALTCLAGTALLGIGLAGVPIASAATQDGVRRAADPRTDTLRRLSAPIQVERFDNPVEEVMQLIVEVTGADLDVMYIDDVNAEGFERDWNLDMTVGRASALQLIERIIDRANSELAPVSEFRWQLAEYGAIQIGPKSRLNRSRQTVVYDINDLLFEVPMFDNAPEFDLNTVLQSSGGSGGQSPFSGNSQQNDDREEREEQAQQIIDLIQATIEPDEWVDFGGTAATVTFISGTLVITAPDYIHREIGGYSFWPKRLQRVAIVDGQRSRQILPADRAAP